MVAEADVCQSSLVVNYLRVSSPTPMLEPDIVDASSPVEIVSDMPIFCSTESLASIGIYRSESSMNCSTTVPSFGLLESSSIKYAPCIRSGSHTSIGRRHYNEDRHIRIDDLSTYLGSRYSWPQSCSFYGVFDGHGGHAASCYVKNNAIRFFFEDVELPQTDDDEKFLHELKKSHRRAYLQADQELYEEHSGVDSHCGTTALTVVVSGKYLLVANVGDCRAVLCRKGCAIQLSMDHRPSCQLERKRVEKLGGIISEDYLNGELAITRALGDWYIKQPFGSPCPLTAEPEFQHAVLTEDDEFLIIGCDGIWDVLSNKEAVKLVRRELNNHGDPQKCAIKLVNQAFLHQSGDNLTAIVVCFTPPSQYSVPSQRSSSSCLSDEGLRILRSLLEGN